MHLSQFEPSVVERYILATLENATTIAALCAAHARGKDNRNFADELAVNALRSTLNRELPVAAEVVIGEGERDEAPMLYIGEKLGPDPGSEPLLQIAVDPLEGTNLCARRGRRHFRHCRGALQRRAVDAGHRRLHG